MHHFIFIPYCIIGRLVKIHIAPTAHIFVLLFVYQINTAIRRDIIKFGTSFSVMMMGQLHEFLRLSSHFINHIFYLAYQPILCPRLTNSCYLHAQFFLHASCKKKFVSHKLLIFYILYARCICI